MLDICELKPLGFGCLRLPHNGDDPSDVDLYEMRRMVDTFLEGGFAYFDTAYSYLRYKSELFVREALTSRHPRESYFLTTKLPCLELNEKSDIRFLFSKQLEKCGVSYFDGYFLHSLNERVYHLAERLGCFSMLEEYKREGKIRYSGFSFHDSPEVLDMILSAHDEIDLVQIQLNYLDWESNTIRSRECLEVCRRHGKPVIVMEPIKGGSLANLSKRAMGLLGEGTPSSWALRFAASQRGVAMVLSGMGNLRQVEENISTFSPFVPLTGDEQSQLGKVADVIRSEVSVPCTGCAYCTANCPMGIPIPSFFSIYNEHRRDGWQANGKMRYHALADKTCPASKCLRCGQCEGKCPQHLKVTHYLEEVADEFEA